MSSTRIRLPFVRSADDGDAATAMGLLQVAYLRQDAPTALRGTRVDVHIATSAADRDPLGIGKLVTDSLHGIAWAHPSCLRAVEVVIGDEEDKPGWTDVWIHLEDGND